MASLKIIEIWGLQEVKNQIKRAEYRKPKKRGLIMFNYFLLYNGTDWIITRNIMKSLSNQGGALIIIPLGKYGTTKATKKPTVDNQGVYIERYKKPQYIYKFAELKRIVRRYV